MSNALPDERFHKALILVVVDAEINRKILKHGLIDLGFSNLIFAGNGSQALQLTRELRPDLVILDLIMPGMDGFAYCQEIRRDHAYDTMPIIVQTALEEREKKLQIFQLGASDYICKPVDLSELSARMQVHLSKKMLMEDLLMYKERIHSEMEAARAMQNRLMPSTQQIHMCERVFDMKIGSYFETSSALGGDGWGVRTLSESKLVLYMYDFSGHGISAAMNIFRMHTIMQEFIHSGSEPGNFLTLMNRHLQPLLERSEFATMFYGVIDTEANSLSYASAATPAALLFSENNAEPVALNGRGFPLGVVVNAAYETQYAPFLPGDLLLLFSDCLIETANNDGAFLTDRQIRYAVQSVIEKTPNPAVMAVDALMQIFRKHSTAPIADDMTISAYWRAVPNGRRASDVT
jgi:sigma-B regulation protein RsbU (phosphoserine phosphatase)